MELTGKSTRTGMVKNLETVVTRRLRYRLHYLLRKKGHQVYARKRTVIKHAVDVTELENNWLKTLIAFDYSIQNPLYERPSGTDHRKNF